MISITKVMQYINKQTMQIQNTYANTGGLCCYRYERFINFWLRFFDTRRETKFLLGWPNYLTPSHARRILYYLRSLSVEILKTQLHASTVENSTLCFNGRHSTICLHGPISASQLTLFKILKFSGSSLPGMTSSTLQPHFLSGGFIMTMMIVIAFAHERKLHQLTMHLGLLTRIFQSPTKLNYKI